MENNDLMLYPSNWLYNAGVIGLLNILGTGGQSKYARKQYGEIGVSELVAEAQRQLTQHAGLVEKPLNNLPKWHWNYALQTFRWNYGTVEEFVSNNFRRAAKTSNRKPVIDQLQCKGFKYESVEVDFSGLNQVITDTFSRTFRRGSSMSLDEASATVVRAIKTQEQAFLFRKAIGFLFSQGGPYKNFYNPGGFKDLRKFIASFTPNEFFVEVHGNVKCGVCGQTKYRTEPVTSEMMTFLFPVYSAFPNAFWTNSENLVTRVCGLCKFILLHYHLGFTRLSDGTWMFVNAPSFTVMRELNTLLRQSLVGSTVAHARSTRELLATSVIEFATKTQATLGVWAGMNVEVITKRDDQVDYVNLPYHVVKLISNRQVAAVLSDIGEFRVLNLVLNEEYSKLPEVGYRLLREAISERRNYDYINDWLYLDQNRRNIAETANKIFKLYTLIEQRRRNAYAE